MTEAREGSVSETQTVVEEPATEPEPVEPVDEAEPAVEPEPEPTDEPTDEPTELGDEETRQQVRAKTAQTDAEVERINRTLDKEARRHAQRVVEIMGEDANVLEQCPLCLPLIPGFRYPVPPMDAQLAAVKEAIGEPAVPPYPKDNYSRECSDCTGLGAVLTGSKVAGQGTARCITCAGRGWVPVGVERQSGALTAPIDGAPAVAYTPPEIGAPDPPEVEALKALGYIVVAPIPTTNAVPV